ncbi:KxYKxGKxW signal peptide domain-containing protein [Pseudolactococcus laudensis]|nr:hypothetical protein BN193_04255 [Lactococcus raffinolactis 4877]
MKDYQSDTKKINYRTWKSGKKWLYASAALVAMAGGCRTRGNWYHA